MPLRKPMAIGGIRFEAFPVQHSIRAPAIGYRVCAAHTRLFYVPDVVAILNRGRGLEGVDVYVGDGASSTRPILRRRGRAVIGHTSIRTQLDWCKAERVKIAYFTHCGREIVTGDARRLGYAIGRLGAERGVEAHVAHDGLQLILGGGKIRSTGAAVAVLSPFAQRNLPARARR